MQRSVVIFRNLLCSLPHQCRKSIDVLSEGVAKTKEEADVIAKREHLLRSFGMAAPNITYGCNSTNSGTMKLIYNASQEITSLPGEEEDY
jgi:hypothetical protein